MRNLESLTEILSRLPGLGPRQARRVAYFLAAEDQNISADLLRELQQVRSSGRYCPLCSGLFFDSGEWCQICRDKDRDLGILMVVENEIDKESAERTATYQGRYFVLGGSVPVNDKELTSKPYLRWRELKDRILQDPGIKEVILAFNYTPQGEHTSRLLADYLKEQVSETVAISSLGRGFSSGTEVEYSDPDTFRYALLNRGNKY